MNFDASDFSITIVSTDTTALRELSWTLSSFGYRVTASSDWSDQAPWQEMNSPALLLLDARDEEEIQVVLSAPRSNDYVYRIAFYDVNLSTNPDRLMDLGSDDLVLYPVNTGELLARIKSGGRRLEFERRFNTAMTFDQKSGMANRRGFIRQLERKLSDKQDAEGGALVVLGIDFISSMHSQFGQIAVDEASAILAKILNDELAREDSRGILQDGVVGVLLQGRSISEGLLFAETISKEVEDRSAAIYGESPRRSLSGVVLTWPSSDGASDTVNRAMTALELIKDFGGNCVLDANQVEKEYSSWKQKFLPYQNVSAQHVMEPLPLVLPLTPPASGDKKGLGVFAFTSGQPIPPCVPVVDDNGHFLGIVDSDTLRRYGSDIFDSLDEHFVPESDTVTSNTPLDAILKDMEKTRKGCSVVVENKKPIGYITHENIAAMLAEPIDFLSVSDETESHEGLSSLVVPLT